jgi:hypothetical protein
MQISAFYDHVYSHSFLSKMNCSVGISLLLQVGIMGTLDSALTFAQLC